jgi:hypothetical protein
MEKENNIKNLYFLYSKYSPYCSQLVKKFPFIKKIFTCICVDNAGVRKAMERSVILKISILPSMLALFDNGTLQLFEGVDSCSSIVEFLTNQQNQKTSISSIVTNQPVVKRPIREERENDEDDIEENLPRKKIDINRGMGIQPPKIERGKGHEKMRSSLAGLGIGNEEKEQDKKEIEKDSIELKPLDEVLEEMEQQPTQKTKKNSETLNKRVMEEAKEREQIQKKEEGKTI